MYTSSNQESGRTYRVDQTSGLELAKGAAYEHYSMGISPIEQWASPRWMLFGCANLAVAKNEYGLDIPSHLFVVGEESRNVANAQVFRLHSLELEALTR
jgi:hypothetical protein